MDYYKSISSIEYKHGQAKKNIEDVLSDIKEDPDPTYPSLLKSLPRESNKIGRR
jgi:hypothetical protein